MIYKHALVTGAGEPSKNKLNVDIAALGLPGAAGYGLQVRVGNA
jgi:hypothetical protein